MWNYEPGQMRCPNDHVFAIESIEGVQARVIRIDRPSRRERLGDALAGFCAAAALAVIIELVHYL